MQLICSLVFDGLDGDGASVEARNTCSTRQFTWTADVGMCLICACTSCTTPSLKKQAKLFLL